jgi:hypothetical protein
MTNPAAGATAAAASAPKLAKRAQLSGRARPELASLQQPCGRVAEALAEKGTI